MQNSVADTSIYAVKHLIQYIRKHKLKAMPAVVLYDSVVSFCPMEERFLVMELHERFMHRENKWDFGDRVLQYPIDTDLCLAWSDKPTEAEKEWLNDLNYMNPHGYGKHGVPYPQ